ncbi:MAG: hypothetical protein Q3X12_06535 [Hallella sp.]|nr:hypothetical protein [Hallella sp.]
MKKKSDSAWFVWNLVSVSLSFGFFVGQWRLFGQIRATPFEAKTKSNGTRRQSFPMRDAPGKNANKPFLNLTFVLHRRYIRSQIRHS